MDELKLWKTPMYSVSYGQDHKFNPAVLQLALMTDDLMNWTEFSLLGAKAKGFLKSSEFCWGLKKNSWNDICMEVGNTGI